MGFNFKNTFGKLFKKGEVSVCSGDENDDRFYEPMDRFPAIEADGPACRPLCTEYPKAAERLTSPTSRPAVETWSPKMGHKTRKLCDLYK